MHWSFQTGVRIAVFALCSTTLGFGAETNQSDVARIQLARGDELLRKGEYQQAIVQYDKAIEVKPDFAEAYNNRGYAKYAKYDGSDALADMNRAIELRPDFPHAYNTRGCVHMARGETELAIADFDRAIELQPDYPRAYRNRANVLMKKGRFRETFADWERVGIDPWRVIATLGSVLLVLLVVGVWLLSRFRRRKCAPSAAKSPS